MSKLYDNANYSDEVYYLWRTGNMGLILFWNGKAWTKHDDNTKHYSLEKALEMKAKFEKENPWTVHFNTVQDNTNWDFS